MKLIAIIGSGACSEQQAQQAEQIGRLLADKAIGIVCGGLGGVMEAACRGASEAGGTTIGILPSESPGDANRYVQIAIPTSLGESRNALVVRAGEAVIAIGGEYGTLSEIGFALRIGKRVVGLETWELHRKGKIDEGLIVAKSPEEAVHLALEG